MTFSVMGGLFVILQLALVSGIDYGTGWGVEQGMVNCIFWIQYEENIMHEELSITLITNFRPITRDKIQMQ